jgi:CheY-like chemotaxis protein
MTSNDSGIAPKADRITILFVDDYADMRAAYALEAEGAGFGVDVATDGYEAVAKALLTPPDIIVAEAMLWGFDGFELARRIARNPRSQQIPVVMLTGIVIPNLAQAAREAGCAAVLTKPCAFDVVERTIRRVLREKVTHARRA